MENHIKNWPTIAEKDEKTFENFKVFSLQSIFTVSICKTHKNFAPKSSEEPESNSKRERENSVRNRRTDKTHTKNKKKNKTKQNGRKGISRVCEEGQGQGEGRGILMAGEYSHDSWGHWQTITRTCVRVHRTSSDEDIRRTWPLVWIMDICVYYGYNGLITFDCVRDRANNGAHINRAGSLAVCVCAHTFSCNCL